MEEFCSDEEYTPPDDFQEWLNYQRYVLGLMSKISDLPYGNDNAQSYLVTVANQANSRAADHRLPELMREWEPPLRIAEVDRYLVELLKEMEKPEPDSDQKDYLTVPEVAKILKSSEDTIRDWINNGQLTASNLGTERNRYFIQRDELNRFLMLRQVEPPPPRNRRKKKEDGNEFRRYRG